MVGCGIGLRTKSRRLAGQTSASRQYLAGYGPTPMRLRPHPRGGGRPCRKWGRRFALPPIQLLGAPPAHETGICAKWTRRP